MFKSIKLAKQLLAVELTITKLARAKKEKCVQESTYLSYVLKRQQKELDVLRAK